MKIDVGKLGTRPQKWMASASAEWLKLLIKKNTEDFYVKKYIFVDMQ